MFRIELPCYLGHLWPLGCIMLFLIWFAFGLEIKDYLEKRILVVLLLGSWGALVVTLVLRYTNLIEIVCK